MLVWRHISQMSDSHTKGLQKEAPASCCSPSVAAESIADRKRCKCGLMVCWWFCINGATEGSKQAFCTVGKGLSQWQRVALGLRHLLISRGNCWAISLTLLGSKQFSKVSGRSHLLGLEAGAGEGGGGEEGGVHVMHLFLLPATAPFWMRNVRAIFCLFSAI